MEGFLHNNHEDEDEATYPIDLDEALMSIAIAELLCRLVALFVFEVEYSFIC